MQIALSEIWNFSELIEVGERGWSYQLQAGAVCVRNITHEILIQLKNDLEYDTELLPLIFTFREIMWQPDVFTEASKSLPGLRILKAHCQDIIEVYDESQNVPRHVYAELLRGLVATCDEAITEIEAGAQSVKKILGSFRTEAFPIVKFFIFHPKNRVDYHQDAINRLNYAVKIMLTQFHGKYTELKDPVWNVLYEQPHAEKAAVSLPEESEKS